MGIGFILSVHLMGLETGLDLMHSLVALQTTALATVTAMHVRACVVDCRVAHCLEKIISRIEHSIAII